MPQLHEEDIPAPEGIAGDIVCEGGNLDCGSGLLLLIRRSMEQVPDGGVLQINSTELSVCEDLPAWCRLTRNPYLGWRRAQGTNHFYVRRGAEAEPGAEAAERRVREHRWQARVAWSPGPAGDPAAAAAKVYCRNHSWEVGQPASFDLSDSAPSAVEYVLGALGACLAQGLQLRASQRGIRIDNIGVQLDGRIDNIYVFLGLETSGHPGFSALRGKAYVQSDAAAEVLQALWREVLAASPVAQTLMRPVALEIDLLQIP